MRGKKYPDHTTAIPVRLHRSQREALIELLRDMAPLKEANLLRVAVWELLNKYQGKKAALKEAYFAYEAYVLEKYPPPNSKPELSPGQVASRKYASRLGKKLREQRDDPT